MDREYESERDGFVDNAASTGNPFAIKWGFVGRGFARFRLNLSSRTDSGNFRTDISHKMSSITSL